MQIPREWKYKRSNTYCYVEWWRLFSVIECHSGIFLTQWREGKETTASVVLQNAFIFGKKYSNTWKSQAVDLEISSIHNYIHLHIGGSRKWISINGITYRMQHGVVILFIRFDWLGSDRLKQKKMYFRPSLCLIFWMSAPMESFCFRATECQSDSLTVPNPPVTRRAAITLTTTVIEPQPVTVPPACILLGSTIKHWCSAFLTLCVCCWEEADSAVRDSWIQQDFLLARLARLSYQLLRLTNLQT